MMHDLDVRVANEKTPKPPFKIHIDVDAFVVEDTDGNPHKVAELKIEPVGGDIIDFILDEAIEDGEFGPTMEFLVYPIGLRVANIDDAPDVE